MPPSGTQGQLNEAVDGPLQRLVGRQAPGSDVSLVKEDHGMLRNEMRPHPVVMLDYFLGRKVISVADGRSVSNDDDFEAKRGG